ncbi:MAG: polyphosphate polymerase domain-containing protein [Draconibacterium sp.]|nr:polyphosphate polymerase domain-containing protein [Draconibacterium sp.]
MKEIDLILSRFHPVSLEEIDEVKLMDRIDRKYWFHISKLNNILESILPYYDILEINGQCLMVYQTTYFDTPENTMYLKHHNRKLNRHKVRVRKYFSTDSDFLEIKRKTNKKRTLKYRVGTTSNVVDFLDSELDFIAEKSPHNGETLLPVLNNNFERLTLIHKNKFDRCTIDIAPKFWNDKGDVKFDNLVIFELKRGRNLKSSQIVSLLRQQKIRQRGLSKYCVGRAVLDPRLKQNAFKPRLRFLKNKIITNE